MCNILELGNNYDLWNQQLQYTIQKNTWFSRRPKETGQLLLCFMNAVSTGFIGMFYYRVSNHAEAEDITQEAFVKAWKAIDKYKRTGAPLLPGLLPLPVTL